MDIGEYAQCISLGENEMTWEDAKIYCVDNHGVLWLPDNEAQSSAVFELFKRLRSERGKNSLIHFLT